MSILEKVNKKVSTILEEVQVFAPVSGKVCDLSYVKDPLFSEKILGDGIAILPEDGIVISPVDGEIVMLFESKHAILIKSNKGVKVFIHIGIDTVALGGKYFETKKRVGDHVKKGEVILTFDNEKIREEGYDTITPVIISNLREFHNLDIKKQNSVGREEILMTIS